MRTADLAERLRVMDCDPIEGMARIAKAAEASGDLALAGRMYSELAPYVAPKHKAIELSVPDVPTQENQQIRITFVNSPHDSDPDMLHSWSRG